MKFITVTKKNATHSTLINPDAIDSIENIQSVYAQNKVGADLSVAGKHLVVNETVEEIKAMIGVEIFKTKAQTDKEKAAAAAPKAEAPAPKEEDTGDADAEPKNKRGR